MSKRLELLNYVDKTLTRLGSTAEIDADELKKKVMPAVVKSIRGYVSGAPAEIMNQLKAILDESGVLPHYEADLNAFKDALKKISDFIKSTLEESSQPAAAEPAEDADAQPEEVAAEEATEEAPEAAEEEAEEAEAAEEVEETVEEPVQKEEPPETEPTPEAEDTEEQSAASKGRQALREYITTTLGKLESTGTPPPQLLKEKILPSVSANLKQRCAGAPNEVRQRIKNILDKTGVISLTADVEGLKQALHEIMDEVPVSAPKEDAPPEATEETPAPEPVSAPKEDAAPARPVLRHQSTMGDRLRGISVQYMTTTFLDEVAEKGKSRSSKVYEIEPEIIRSKGEDRICPRDNEIGAAYVDCLDEGDAGNSTHMLSYTWGYEIGDISDSLMSFCNNKKLDPRSVFFWICCLCINQHRVKAAQEKKESVPFEKFKEEFAHRVSSIGHVVAMMAPWQDPSYTKRVWCDFEMYTAATLGIQVSVTMPPRESQDMKNTLLSGSASNSELWKALQNVKVEEAQASVQEDKERILKMIEEGPGFHGLNSTVTKCIQDWVEKTCIDLYEHLESSEYPKGEKAEMASHVGYVLRDMAKNAQALTILQHAKDLFKQAEIFNTVEFCSLMSNIGVQKRRTGDLTGALKDMEQSRKAFERNKLDETKECAMMYNSLGAARRANKQQMEAHEAFTRAEEILHNMEVFESNEGASLMNSLGSLNKEMGDLDTALKNFATAKQILESIGEMCSPSGQVLMNSIASAKKDKHDSKGALEAYLEMRHILERIGRMDSDDGPRCLWSIGLTQKRLKDFDGAKETMIEAQALVEKLRLTDSEQGQKIKGLLSELEGGKGKGDGKGKKGDGNASGGKNRDGKSSGGKGYQSKGKKDGGETSEHGKGNKGKGKGGGGKSDGGKGKSKGNSSEDQQAS
mmetsp:Transcript_8163/g.15403  ORF Transcript_8163/g.15403 Transcript_8163/m.15403 type:complete len:916 (-) Transcript_8163:58-2805(-)